MAKVNEQFENETKSQEEKIKFLEAENKKLLEKKQD